MATVVGVDPSFACTGVALWVNGRVRTFSIKTSAALSRAHREIAIVDALAEQMRPTTVATLVEDVYQSPGGMRGRTSLDLAGLHDCIVTSLVRKNIPVGIPTAKGCKSFATQNGNASKAEMVQAALQLLGVSVANHNEADALWLAMMGVVSLGGTLNHWPATTDRNRTAVLAKIRWISGHPGTLLQEE